jgi:predicted metal-dependent peptidase
VTIHEDIAKISKKLMFAEPFYGLFLLTLNKKVDEAVGTAGVSKNGINSQLTVAPKFWNTLTDDQKAGLLKHELLHIVFFHLQMRDRFADKKLFNIAADMEINQYIAANMLPPGAIKLDSFPGVENLIPFNGTKYYYDELYKQQGNSPQLQAMLQQMASGGGTVADHSTWDEFEDMGEAEKELMKKQIDHQVKDILENNKKNCGKIPGELQSYIDSLFEIKPAVFDWKGYLRRFVGQSTKVYTKKTRRKLNKRFSALPALKIKTKNHILVAVDTSGSVSDKELEELFSEIHHIYKTGVMVTVAQADADIHDIREYKGKFDGRISGRGGTAFQPVIDYYDQHKSKYSTLIYMTDTYAACPTKPRGSMMWVVSSNGADLSSLTSWPGIKIKIPKT